jgi:hypothetical protein
MLEALSSSGRTTQARVTRSETFGSASRLVRTDGVELVRKLYGHRDHERALDRVTAAYGRTASLTQLRLV